jgi:hypothetical protein
VYYGLHTFIKKEQLPRHLLSFGPPFYDQILIVPVDVNFITTKGTPGTSIIIKFNAKFAVRASDI